jgi:hypothetical protein
MKSGPASNGGGLNYRPDEFGRKGTHQGAMMDPNNPMGGGKMFQESSDSESESSNSSVGSNNELGANSTNKQSFSHAPNIRGDENEN